MGQEVKNPLRAQSKYGLMGSSAKTGKKISAGHRSSFWIKLSFGIGYPPAIHQMQSICVGEGSRVPNLQTEFNYLDSFKSYGIFSDFHCPHVVAVVPHMVPIIPPSSPSSPHHPHSPQKVPMWSPWLWSPLSPPGTTWGQWGQHGCCPCGPRHPHVIQMSSLLFPCHPHHPHSPQKVPMWSPWLWSPLSPLGTMWWQWGQYGCCPCGPHHLNVIPTSSSHHLEGPHIIPNPPDTHPTHTPPPWWVGGPESVKML